LRQSIERLLTTPIGARLMRRDVGSDVSNLIDAPNHGATHLQLYAAMAAALMRWEPRFRLIRVQCLGHPEVPGQLLVELEGAVMETGESLPIRLPLSTGQTV